ncbi:MAG: hypothetical protein ISS92_02705 [Candidatus Omnitrophica bacterium]|nr:hypothetical protein [Candidatus Omnitrophota bacterium]
MKKLVLLMALFLFTIPAITCSADEIKGRIESVSAADNKLTISGVTINVSPNAWVEGHNDMQISIRELAVGNYIECKGNWSGSAEFTANKVELETP